MCLEEQILSPEEKLGLFTRYLENRDPRALEMFSRNSSTNQLLTFLQSAPFKSTNYIVRIGEYIVIKNYELPRDNIFIVGLDDNYRFFCHRLAIGNRSLNLEELDEKQIRNLMGFDYHAWEMKPTMFRDGVRVRIQGDVVLRFARVFRSEEELYAYLCLGVFLEIANIRVLLPERVSWELRRRISTIAENFDCYEDPIGILKNILSGVYIVPPIYQDRINEEVYRVMQNIRHLEHRLNIVVGNHRIQIIGVRGQDITNSFQIKDSILEERNSILILRQQDILAMHDEHRTSTLHVPRSIVQLTTLAGSNLQITRERAEEWPRTKELVSEKIIKELSNMLGF